MTLRAMQIVNEHRKSDCWAYKPFQTARKALLCVCPIEEPCRSLKLRIEYCLTTARPVSIFEAIQKRWREKSQWFYL
jgi:hypothetical protein